MKNIFAYTETEYKTYPGYVSYNRQDNGAMTLSVRSKNSSGVQEIEFPLYKFWQFVDAVSNFDLPADVEEIEFLPKEFFNKLAEQYAEKEEELASAKQRELELLAVIEKQHELLSNALKYPAQRFEPSQALRDHEAKVVEECAGRFGVMGITKAIENELRSMAEERRKK